MGSYTRSPGEPRVEANVLRPLCWAYARCQHRATRFDR